MSAKEFRITVIPRWADIDANQHVRNTALSECATRMLNVTKQERALPSTTFTDLHPADGDTCPTPVPVVGRFHDHTCELVTIRRQRSQDRAELIRQAPLQYKPVLNERAN
jgi:hypothetical protein